MKKQPLPFTIDANATFKARANEAAKSAAHYHTHNKARATFNPAYVTYNPNPLIAALGKVMKAVGRIG
jgi:hypothetical protein